MSNKVDIFISLIDHHYHHFQERERERERKTEYSYSSCYSFITLHQKDYKMISSLSLTLLLIIINLDRTESLTPSEALHLNTFDNFTSTTSQSNLQKAVLRWTNPDYESVFYKISNVVRSFSSSSISCHQSTATHQI